ncbi:hypothetical protein [Streptomyces sp. NPDC046942]|uniref:hypothetical protein n=1 Tax=Streptomyces sp. NPDC046942 TaxID=3155137 RepID=UPI0033D23561
MSQVPEAGSHVMGSELAVATITSFTAIASSWLGARSGRLNAEIAVRAEHRNQRRDPREAAYREFLTAASRLRDSLASVTMVRPVERDRFTQEFVEAHPVMAASVKAAWLEVALAGPKSVRDAATEFEASSRGAAIMATMIRHGFDTAAVDADMTRVDMIRDFVAEVDKLNSALGKFIELAQISLEDDGTIRAKNRRW